MCHIAGWGVADTGRGVYDLRVVDVSVVDQNICRRQFSRIPANVICAGGYGTLKGVCFVSFLSVLGNIMNTLRIFFASKSQDMSILQGDSGGPLVCNGVAAGVASYIGGGCWDERFPNVYTDVSKFRPWIDQILSRNGC